MKGISRHRIFLKDGSHSTYQSLNCSAVLETQSIIRRVQNERNFRGKRVSATALSRSHFFQFIFFLPPHPPLLKGEGKIFSRKSATLEKRLFHTAVESHLWDTSIQGTPSFKGHLYSSDTSIQGTQDLVPEKCSHNLCICYIYWSSIQTKGTLFLGPETLVNLIQGHLAIKKWLTTKIVVQITIYFFSILEGARATLVIYKNMEVWAVYAGYIHYSLLVSCENPEMFNWCWPTTELEEKGLCSILFETGSLMARWATRLWGRWINEFLQVKKLSRVLLAPRAGKIKRALYDWLQAYPPARVNACFNL